jgi:hypothetical protein
MLFSVQVLKMQADLLQLKKTSKLLLMNQEPAFGSPAVCASHVVGRVLFEAFFKLGCPFTRVLTC